MKISAILMVFLSDFSLILGVFELFIGLKLTAILSSINECLRVFKQVFIHIFRCLKLFKGCLNDYFLMCWKSSKVKEILLEIC